MSDDFATLVNARKPTAERPLLGLTVLVVEDSRFACEAMRLLCLRSGARIRRADCLASAHRHLSVYRPSTVVVDMGLPDGSGAELIHDLASSAPRVPVLLGISGDAGEEQKAMTAGADGFLLKPITSLAAFQQAILDRMPVAERPVGPRKLSSASISPDPIALRDDLSHVAEILSTPLDTQTLGYIAQFLSSLAQCASDTTLERAAAHLKEGLGNDLPVQAALGEINDYVETRLTGTGPL
ncbi:response regulator receiver domain-containing protein [Aliiruegeria haliotis]|uniref:Response regulator receiver domain-containing protein n=1 Tax=Aliiruegeria haliotis TaxID=1280846 RepID=A0A2T0RWQ0_9RHOB|nr:response regulator [Aliiruegeria haliotis]PRY25588.1 response regulator receiver domain-containing protein [Aliiruegeria haliotis]